MDLVLAGPDAGGVAVPEERGWYARRARAGLVLMRTLVASEARLDELDQARRRFVCEPAATPRRG